MDYIYTISGSRTEEDAIDFMVGILMTEYCDEAATEAVMKGFKRTLAQTDKEIEMRLQRMTIHSKSEYSYTGSDKKGPIYTFFGKTSYELRKTGSHNGIS